MKILIVFMGLLLINVSIMSFKGDYGRYAYLARTLDNIAFECAEMAVQSEDEIEAKRYAEALLEYTRKNLENIEIRNCRCEVYFEGGFAVTRVRMDVKNLFRFPFSPVTSVIAERKLIVL